MAEEPISRNALHPEAKVRVPNLSKPANSLRALALCLASLSAGCTSTRSTGFEGVWIRTQRHQETKELETLFLELNPDGSLRTHGSLSVWDPETEKFTQTFYAGEGSQWIVTADQKNLVMIYDDFGGYLWRAYEIDIQGLTPDFLILKDPMWGGAYRRYEENATKTGTLPPGSL